MIDTVSYLNSITSAATSTNAKTGSSGKTGNSEMGKDAFLQLMINQMSHQDPLEPMDNSQFLAQLAQFSSLEQMQNLNTSMQTLALSQAASTNSQMVNLIGKRVVVPGSEFTLNPVSAQSGDTAQSVNIKYKLEGQTVPTEVIISDSKGNVVRRMQVTGAKTGMNTIQFDGKDNNGNVLPAGNYTYKMVDGQGKAVNGLTTYSNYLVDAVAFSGTDIQLKSKTSTIAVKDITEVIQ